jgi:hypothetical protein
VCELRGPPRAPPHLAGVLIDADHAGALTWCNIFVSNDGILVDSLKTLSTTISRQTKQKLQPSVVTTANELRKAIETQKKLHAKLKHGDRNPI